MPYMLMVEDMNWFECTNANPSEIMQMVQISTWDQISSIGAFSNLPVR